MPTRQRPNKKPFNVLRRSALPWKLWGVNDSLYGRFLGTSENDCWGKKVFVLEVIEQSVPRSLIRNGQIILLPYTKVFHENMKLIPEGATVEITYRGFRHGEVNSYHMIEVSQQLCALRNRLKGSSKN